MTMDGMVGIGAVGNCACSSITESEGIGALVFRESSYSQGYG